MPASLFDRNQLSVLCLSGKAARQILNTAGIHMQNTAGLLLSQGSGLDTGTACDGSGGATP